MDVFVFASTLMNVTPGGLHPRFSNLCNLTPPNTVNQPPWRTARQSEQPPRGQALTAAHTLILSSTMIKTSRQSSLCSYEHKLTVPYRGQDQTESEDEDYYVLF